MSSTTRRTFPVVTALAALLLAACGDGSGDAESPDSVGAAQPTIAAADSAASGAAAGVAAASGALLHPDSVTREQLTAIPGVTAVAADALLGARPHADMRAVDRALAPHLAEPVRDSVYTRVWKPIDLNAATAEEIELIPGVGPRMRHEFEEYRPYTSIEQFRREIGKYVDEAEVARLERYVRIPTGG